MVRLIGLLFALIGYVCTATVITLALCLGYLWYTDRLNDEKVFRIVALLHDVDLQQLAETQPSEEDQIPAVELSLEDVTRSQQVKERNFEVKQLALERGRHEYDLRLQQLKEQTARYDRLAQDWQKKLQQQEELVTQENVATVVRDLEQVKPTVAKDLLLRWIDEERMDDVILLMNKMSESKLAKLLKTFQTSEELDKLHEIHQRIINGGEEKAKLNKAIDELKGINSTG
ncbi:MAG: hypothetical protein L0Z07_04120 [Planctomycetes bacterium]|nr:hypothetical protein [Planctomycetota bacterium]